jgi:EpsI family protein
MTLLMDTRKKMPKVFLMLVSVPLAIGMNGVRLACTGYLSREHGSWAIEGVYHDLIGWFFFGISIVILLGIMSLLDSSPVPSGVKQNVGLRFNGFGRMRTLESSNVVPIMGICMVGFLLVFLSFRSINNTNYTNEISFHSFPLHIGTWNGKRSVIPMETLDALNSSNYALIDYEDHAENTINLYIIHYAHQTKGSSIHSPETCFRGGGWQFEQSDRVEIFNNYHVNRSILTNNENQVLSYFWFICRGRNLTNAMELKFYNFWDRLISGRSDGSLVRVVTPIMGGDVDSAEARLKNFVLQLVPILNSYVDNNA